MTVGEFAGIPLQDAGDTWRHGAVFRLKKPAQGPGSVSLNGWVTTVVHRQKFVIICGPSSATDFEATFIESLNAANRGLDYLSVTGQADCSICEALDDSLIWWPDAARGGVVVRCQAVQPWGMKLSATIVQRDALGNVVPSPPPPTPMADDAFRFIRMARTSDDLFDSYRNLFLAFESLLSDIRPRQPRAQKWWKRWRAKIPGAHRNASAGNAGWEPEHRWFSDALDVANGLVPIAELTGLPRYRNHKKWIQNRMYSDQRSGLMHAKRGQRYLLPHDAEDRTELIEALGRLSDYSKKLVESHLHVRGQSSFVSLSRIALTSQQVLPQYPLVISDDNGRPLNLEADENLIDPNATVVQLSSSTPRVDPNDRQLWWMLAHCDRAAFTRLTAIRRFGSMRTDGSGKCDVVSELVGPLVLGSTVARLEIDRGYRYVNPTGPPRQFSS